MATAGTGKLGRREILRAIENNNGPVGLDLTGMDMSEADISSDTIKKEAEIYDVHYRRVPVWQSSATGGIDLHEAILRGANLRRALLWRGDYRRADLSGAQLHKADLGYALLAGANLTSANLEGAILSRADLQDADLTGAKLTNAEIEEVDLSATKSLHNVYFCGARLAKAYMLSLQIKNGTGEERDKDYYRAKEAYYSPFALQRSQKLNFRRIL